MQVFAIRKCVQGVSCLYKICKANGRTCVGLRSLDAKLSKMLLCLN